MTDAPRDLAALPEVDFALLLALEVLLAERNVTRAAARLGIGQPTLSARLSRLRYLFDDQLFVPAAGGRGLVPTPRALALEGSLKEALGLFRRMLHPPERFDPATSRRTFTVALEEQRAAALAPRSPPPSWRWRPPCASLSSGPSGTQRRNSRPARRTS